MDLSSGKSFAFSALIDPEVLYSLYENDYHLIQQIFYTTIANFEEDLQVIRSGFTAGNMEALRKGVHKIKPVFGFVGMQRLEEACGLFEEKCRTSSSPEELSGEMASFLQSVEQARKAIEADYHKLIVFNKP